MLDTLKKEDVYKSIIYKLKEGDSLESEIELLLICIKHFINSGNLISKVDQQWFANLSCDILSLLKPSIEKLDDESKKLKYDKILNEILRLILREVEDVFNTTFKEVTKTLSSLLESSETETFDDSLIAKIKDCVHTLKILCDSMKAEVIVCHQNNEQFIPLVCRLMLMEWLTEKDFVILNQIASLFLSFGNEEHKKVKENIKGKNLYSTLKFSPY